MRILISTAFCQDACPYTILPHTTLPHATSPFAISSSVLPEVRPLDQMRIGLDEQHPAERSHPAKPLDNPPAQAVQPHPMQSQPQADEAMRSVSIALNGLRPPPSSMLAGNAGSEQAAKESRNVRRILQLNGLQDWMPSLSEGAGAEQLPAGASMESLLR